MDTDQHTDLPQTSLRTEHLHPTAENVAHSKLKHLKQAWKTAFQIPFFCWNALLTLIAGIVLAYIAQLFFPYIQQRHGITLYDPLLQLIPAHDVSLLLFACLYIPMLVWLTMLIAYPRSLLQVLMSIIALQTLRLITIWAIPLDPPQNCITLRDPLVYILAYHHLPVTRDLFFSGHTATMMVFYLAAPKNKKHLLIIWMAVVILLLLIQHAHYSIDILAAILIAPAIWIWMEIYLSRGLNGLPTWEK